MSLTERAQNRFDTSELRGPLSVLREPDVQGLTSYQGNGHLGIALRSHSSAAATGPFRSP